MSESVTVEKASHGPGGDPLWVFSRGVDALSAPLG